MFGRLFMVKQHKRVAAKILSFFFSRLLLPALKHQRRQYKQQRQQKEPSVCTSLEDHKATIEG